MNLERRRKLPHDASKVCGSCRFLRRPIYYSNKLMEACEKAGKSKEIRTETLAELTYEVLTLNREKFWCSRDRCCTHLLDNCSLWQPRKDETDQILREMNCSK